VLRRHALDERARRRQARARRLGAKDARLRELLELGGQPGVGLDLRDYGFRPFLVHHAAADSAHPVRDS
jgi:hypothetical protein